MKNKKGFVFIEIIISIMAISMLVVVICSINIMVLRINVMNKKSGEAFNIARGVCELFKAENNEFSDDELSTLYIPVQSLDDIESIDEIFKNINMFPKSLNSAVEGKKKYVLMLNLSKKQGKAIIKGNIPYIYVLTIKFYTNGEYILTMIQSR